MELEETVETALRELESAQNLTRKDFLRKRREVVWQFGHEEWILFMRKWQEQHKEEYPVPELIGYNILREIGGQRIYEVFVVGEGNPQELLEKIFENYGVLTDEKCQIFIEKKDKSTRRILNQAFFLRRQGEKSKQNEHREENARTIIQYAWKKYWRKKYPLPELITHEDIVDKVGETVYTALEVLTGRSRKVRDLLKRIVQDYGIFDEEKCKVFIEKKDKASRNTLCKVFFSNKEDAAGNAAFLVEYAWDHLWGPVYHIPEFMYKKEVYKTFGKKVYEILGVNCGNSNDLFQKVFKNYGILDEEKCRYYLEHSDEETGQRWKKIFLTGEHAAKNAAIFIRGVWQQQWKPAYGIPERIDEREATKTIEEDVYEILKTNPRNVQELLAKVFGDYGILTDEKCRYYLEHGDEETRQEMTKMFLTGKYAVKNARTLLHYAREHCWNKKGNTCKEVPESDIRNTLGEGIYNALTISGGNLQTLLVHMYKRRRRHPELFE